MLASELKETILNNSYTEQILEEIGCHSIVNHGEYITCANKTGDNKQAIVIYLNDNLTCINYTRSMSKEKRTHDIFDLVSYNQEISFPEALKFVCDIIGIDYYNFQEELPESLQVLRMLKDMEINDGTEDNTPLKPISEKILSYYLPYGNVMFQDDGISLRTQQEWEIKYDPQSNSIVIPLRDEFGTLIAIKARRFKYTQDTPPEKRRFDCILAEEESKYFFLEPGAKSQILFGLYKNFNAIQKQGIVYVGESEKFCLQLYDMGYYGVSCGGSKLSKRQTEMLTRLGVKICLCFDKDINEEKLQNIANGFIDGVPIYAIIDKDNILDIKQSPSDDVNKWVYMIKNNIYKIK